MFSPTGFAAKFGLAAANSSAEIAQPAEALGGDSGRVIKT